MADIVRIAAVADVHVAKAGPAPAVQALLGQVTDVADVLLMCGDLTHYGRVEEAETLAKELRRIHIPILAVLGNHDFHSDQNEAIDNVLTDAGVHVLDGETIVVKGIGFAGVKGSPPGSAAGCSSRGASRS